MFSYTAWQRVWAHTCAKHWWTPHCSCAAEGWLHGQTLSNRAAEMGPRKSLTVLITESSWPASQASPRKASPCGTCSWWHSLWAHIWQQAGNILKDVFICFSIWLIHFTPTPLHSDTPRLKYVFCSCGRVTSGSWILCLRRWLQNGAQDQKLSPGFFIQSSVYTDLPQEMVQVRARDSSFTPEVSDLVLESCDTVYAPHLCIIFNFPSTVHTKGSLGWNKSAHVKGFL